VKEGLEIAFFGSSLVSAWWNGACTYYRGIIAGLHQAGHRVTFYEPVAYQRQEHRDIPDPDYARVVIYPAESEAQVRQVVASAGSAEVVVKTSGVGAYDEVLEAAVLEAGRPGALRIFWDVDAPATLGRMEDDVNDSLRTLLPDYDLVLTYGGGRRVVDRYLALGARECEVVYNAFDPATHHPSAPRSEWEVDCSLLANRLPDREARIDEFFFRAAHLLPDRRFLLGGNGWEAKAMPSNVGRVGHVGPDWHNAFNSSPRCVLNVTRDSMVTNGWSPATRVFEAAGAGACLITDRWDGISDFLDPGEEVLVASDGAQVAELVSGLTPEGAARIGRRARERVLAQHTYQRRAAQVDQLLRSRVGA
jgi:spore maturation protein CgeB